MTEAGTTACAVFHKRRGERGSVGLGPALLVSVALGGAAALVAGLWQGPAAAWGVVVGAVVVVAVFSSGMTLTQAAASLSPALSLLVALLTYTLQLVVLVVVLTALERSTLLESTLDRSWIGGTIIVGTLVWSAALVRTAMRGVAHYHSGEERGESVEPPASPPPSGDGTAR